MAADVPCHLIAKVVALVVHGQQYPVQIEPRIECALHPLDRAHQLAEPFQCIKFALQWHQHRIGRDQRIDRQQVQ